MPESAGNASASGFRRSDFFPAPSAPPGQGWRMMRRRMHVKVLSVIKVTFGLVGAGLLAGAIAVGVSTRQFLAAAQRAEGTVVDVLPYRSGSSDGSVLYTPVVEFKTPDGQQH